MNNAPNLVPTRVIEIRYLVHTLMPYRDYPEVVAELKALRNEAADLGYPFRFRQERKERRR